MMTSPYSETVSSPAGLWQATLNGYGFTTKDDLYIDNNGNFVPYDAESVVVKPSIML